LLYVSVIKSIITNINSRTSSQAMLKLSSECDCWIVFIYNMKKCTLIKKKSTILQLYIYYQVPKVFLRY
jgi:hypothetical protein